MRTKVEIAIGAVLAAAIAMSEARVSAATMAVDAPASGGASPATTSQPLLPILKIADKRVSDALRDDKEPWSTWKYFEVWQTDVCRLESRELVRVDPIDPRLYKDKDGQWAEARPKNMTWEMPAAVYKVKPTQRIHGSANPPEKWMAPEFDDGQWARSNGRARFMYRGISLMCLRGRFLVSDPGGVQSLHLSVGYQGGIVLYLNGREVGRGHLPAGALTPEMLADDYPNDAYFKPDGSAPALSNRYLPGDYCTEYVGYKSDAFLARRTRRLQISIPPSLLQKGVNVLALEIHRAPLAEAAVTKNYKHKGSTSVSYFWWNRCEVEHLTLNARANPGAIQGNCSVPGGMRVWEQSPLLVNRLDFGDTCELPVRANMIGLRNGVAHAQLMVGSDRPIRNLRVVAEDLKGPAGVVPRSAIQVGFIASANDGLEPEAPAEIMKELLWRNGPSVLNQPIWIIVQVPRAAAPGVYAGQATVSAEGEKPVIVPVKVELVGSWVVPDGAQFRPYVAIMESPETVAAQYKVPLWSDAHWAHLDRVFKMMGQLGAREIHIGLQSETHIGNQHTIVYWEKQLDGSYKYDLTVADRYIGLAAKHLGPNVNVICAINYGQYCPVGYIAKPPRPHRQLFTVRDPKTGELKEEVAPSWGTPEALAFWKPVLEGLHQVMAKHKVSTELSFQSFQFDCGNPAFLKDILTMIPGAKLACRSHYDHYSKEERKVRLYLSTVGGAGVFWDPDNDAPCYNWRRPSTQISFGRDGYPFKDYSWGWMRDDNPVADFYQYPERVMLTGVSGNPHMSLGGFGHWGADYWPVLIDGDTEPKRLINRYVQTTGLTVYSLFHPGRTGPTPTARSEMLREGMQDFEARAFVQDALLDHADKLGPDLAKRAKEVCDERTRFHLQGSYFGWGTGGDVTPFRVKEMKLSLYRLVDEIANAVGR